MSSPRVVTLGCRLNAAESEVMRALAIREGLHQAIIVNTCAVTAEAERQARQTIRHLRKENPEATILVTGCAVQLRPEVFAAMPEIDRVVGNDGKMDGTRLTQGPRVQVGPMPVRADTPFPVLQMEGKAKAFVQVQNGCNHFCAFCTIPLARGRSRSVPPAHLVSHMADLLAQGVQEIILTGVDLTSYAHEGMTLGPLIHHLLERLPTLQRLRLSSLDSIEISEDLLALIGNDQRILPHIHLSLQSGSTPILKTMKRRHTRDQALAICHRLKTLRPEIALGADFIAGFPGETEAMFEETLAFVEEGHLTHLHVFPFSKRPGTLAARMAHQIAPDIIKARACLLREKGQTQVARWLSSQVGSVITVLMEQTTKGYSDDFSQVRLTHPVTPQTLIRARVVDWTPTFLLADPLS